MKISVVVLTKNEEKNIKACLESALWADECIVIDDFSTDNTKEIAKKLGAKVFTHALEDDFSKQRNFGLQKATNEWIFFLDADERITPLLRDEINNVVSHAEKNSILGFFIPRKDYMWGKFLTHGESGNIRLVRLGKKLPQGLWQGNVHETWNIPGSIGTLTNSLLHYPHQTLSEFLEEINMYTSLRAKELYTNKVRSNALSIMLYPIGKFLTNYYIKLGFLDGIPGLLHAIIMSFHSFLVRGKLWLLWHE